MSGGAGKPQTDFDTFLALDIRAGKVVDVQPFPEARKPAFKLELDLGDGDVAVEHLTQHVQMSRCTSAACANDLDAGVALADCVGRHDVG